MAPKKLCVVTTSRADYGLYYHTMKKIGSTKQFTLQIVASGTHLSKEYGNTIDYIAGDGFAVNERIDILDADTHEGIGKSSAKAIEGFTRAFAQLKPDAVLLLGDRYEMLAAAYAAGICIIPAVHFHGGEISEGANDDMFRHAITKLSALHFVSTPVYRKRVIQLGEQPSRVIVSGALGIESIKKVKLLDKDALQNKFGIQFKKNVFLVTFHPATMEKNSPEKQVKEMLMALNAFTDTTFIVTKANADAHGHHINQILEEFCKTHRDCYLSASLGQLNYLSAMSLCDVVIGNSSSGIIEAPSLNKPTVNIGSRQKGRIKAKSVIDCKPVKADIIKAIKKALKLGTKKKISNPYDKGIPSDIIIKTLQETNFSTLLPKTFYDIK